MYKTHKISGIEVIDIPPAPGQGVVVLLHGYGADAHDLAPLSHVLKVPVGMGWLIPNGPLQIPIGPGFYGRAWAPINMEEWQRAMTENRPRDLSKENPPELKTSASVIMEMIKTYNISLEKIVFAGFSQGAMLATHLTLNSPTPPKGLIIFSGSLINKLEWEKIASKKAGLKFFQSHGNRDEILSYQGAVKLNEFLVSNGLLGSLSTFSGGHEIPPLALQGAQNYLFDIFPDKNSWQE